MEEIRCSICGSIVEPGNTFCPACGSPIEVPVQPTMPAQPEFTAQPEMPMQSEFTAQPEPDMGPFTNPGDEGTTVLTGNPFAQNFGADNYQQGYAQENPMGQDAASQEQYIPYDSTGTQYGNGENAGVYSQTEGKPKKGASNGLGIAAMIVGILAILCCPLGFLLGIIGIILSIVCFAKKTGKPFCIIGLITSILGCVIGIVSLVVVLTSDGIGATFGMDGSIISSFASGDNGGSSGSGSSISDVKQVMINGDIYKLPGDLNDMELFVDDSYSDVVSNVAAYGMEPGDVEFVLLESYNGYTMWGYLENVGKSTEYSIYDLKVTGLNVDNYSGECTANSMTVFDGISLGYSRSEVESIIGAPDSVDTSSDGSVYDVYSNTKGDTVLRIGYDGYDYIQELDVTYYYN